MTTPRKHLYLIALVPPQTVLDDVLEFKNELKSQFGASHALKLPGHITLQMPFWMHENHRPTLMANLETFSKEQKSFPIFFKWLWQFSATGDFYKNKRSRGHNPIARRTSRGTSGIDICTPRAASNRYSPPSHDRHPRFAGKHFSTSLERIQKQALSSSVYGSRPNAF